MGIKGIYGEIGSGERIALSKLAIQKFEETGRPLRIAIDISIWQFQIQAGQGGSNPAIRTFYYRLLRLLLVSVQPLFVFDGPRKPPFKRNKRSGHHGASIPNLMTKQLLHLFGFPIHMAPGEAEAECALLQREGIVDAVLSEDVDTLMFGSGLTLRNWSSEGRGSKSPTHVSAYHAKATKEGKSGLDREGMVLVALMSGGDYITEGIPGCGIKVACEAARAGFGNSLCKLLRSDTVGLDTWRKNLAHEIQTNESKFFRIKHKALKITENFPDREVLGYYTHPVVSSATKIQSLKEEIAWDGEIDIPGLRLFVAEAFDWTHKTGAKKFIRGLAPALLVHKLRRRGDRRTLECNDIVLTAMNEMKLIRAICGKRAHFSTDGVQELRVLYHPMDIVGLNLDMEEEDSENYGRDGLAPVNGNDEIEAYVSDLESISRSTRSAVSAYDPTSPNKLWIFETIAKVGVPLKVEDYEESLRNPRKFLKAKATAKKVATKGGMPKGSMNKFLNISKPGFEEAKTRKTRSGSSQPSLPPVYLAPTLREFSASGDSISVSSQNTHQTRSGASPNTTVRNPAMRMDKSSKTIKTSTSRRKAISEKQGPKMNTGTKTLSPPPQAVPSVIENLSPHPQEGCLNQFQRLPSLSLEQMLSCSPLSSPPSHSAQTLREYTQIPQLENKLEEEERLTNIAIARGIGVVEHCLSISSSSEKERGIPSRREKHSSLASSAASSLGLSADSILLDLTPEPTTDEGEALFSVSRACFSSTHLPSLQDLASSSGLTRNSRSVPKQVEVILLPSSPEATKSHTREGVNEVAVSENNVSNGVSGKKYIMLRESLPGGWKGVDASELVHGRSRAWRYSQVECLDLSVE